MDPEVLRNLVWDLVVQFSISRWGTDQHLVLQVDEAYPELNPSGQSLILDFSNLDLPLHTLPTMYLNLIQKKKKKNTFHALQKWKQFCSERLLLRFICVLSKASQVVGAGGSGETGPPQDKALHSLVFREGFTLEGPESSWSEELVCSRKAWGQLPHRQKQTPLNPEDWPSWCPYKPIPRGVS